MKRELEVPQDAHPIKTASSPANKFKFFGYSSIGIFMFFIPISINGKSSIMLDHIVTSISSISSKMVTIYALLILLAGALYPFINKSWNQNITNIIFSILKLLGLVFGSMIVFNIGPAWLFDPDMGPFLMEKLIKPVSLLVPIGAVFLALLVSYGLLEFVGVFMQPVMRPIFKTPGRSAVDAVASFVGSYSIGLLVTNRIFNEGKYTIREAAITATGFSTVSVTFMVVIANTLDLMPVWNLYFWISLIVTFTVTAITVRIWPLNKMSNEYINGEGQPEQLIKKDRLKHAWRDAMNTADATPGLLKNISINLKDGLLMTMSILPNIMSVGLLGLVLATYTPLFDWVGYIFYPITWGLQLPEPLITAKAAAISISEIFLPALLVVETQLITKFIVAVLSVSSILFFSAIIPCILATDIPISVPKLVVIWFERVVLTLLIITPIAFLLF
ncbi:YjiH family protein [Siminovitchia terrae]|nr:YjiH family protein [Siminovitchia terrae]